MGDKAPAIIGDDWDTDSRSFVDSPTLENYLAMRTAYPGREPPVTQTPVLNRLTGIKQDLDQWGFDFVEVARAANGDVKSIDRLSEAILTHIHLRESLAERGETHVLSTGKAIPNDLVRGLVHLMLEGLAVNAAR